jgi:hypothetical protein
MQARSLTLSPRQTSVQNIKQLLNALHLSAKGIERGGISIVHTGHPGDLTAHGIIEDQLGRFASNITFIDPVAQPETPLEANGLMLAHPSGSAFPGATFFTPVLALKNSSGSAQVATVTVQYTVNGSFQSKSLPAVSIAPHDVVMVDFSLLLAKLRSASIDSAGLKIQSSRRGALLIAQLTSIDQNQSMCVDALVERVPGGLVGKGAHPFHLDGDNQAVVHLKNLSKTKTTAILQVLYDGGEFSPELVHLGPGQSVAVDVRRLRDSQADDIHGDKLPLDLERGQVQWFQRGNQSVVGHLISFSASRGVSSSFACPGLCCPPDYLASKVNPSTITGLPGESFTVTVTETRLSQCTHQVMGPYNVTSEAFIYSSNAIVAQVSGTTVTLLNGGTAQILADLTAFDFGGDTSDCPMPINTRTCAPTCSEFDFPATTDSPSAAKTQVPTSLSQSIGPLKTYNGTAIVAPDGRVLIPVAYGYSRLITYTVLDQDGQQIKRSGMSATEDVHKVSSNPGNIDGDVFTTGVTVNSNGQFSDIQAFFKISPPAPQPGEFLKQKQRIDIQRPGIAWTVRWNCINKQSNDFTLTITDANGSCQ